MATCRKVVGHFKHSPKATKKLHGIQERLGLPQHKLSQEVVTRWDSGLEMMIMTEEQKQALLTYVSENSLETSLSSAQWRLMSKVGGKRCCQIRCSEISVTFRSTRVNFYSDCELMNENKMMFATYVFSSLPSMVLFEGDSCTGGLQGGHFAHQQRELDAFRGVANGQILEESDPVFMPRG